ncbi:SAM-dependent methyltransferase, partial [Mycolicibacterium elephantis]
MGLKQKVPFLRWSVWRFALGLPGMVKTGQIGDGREQACAAFVEQNARQGDVDDVLSAIDDFAYNKSMLMNVGDEKGALLDAAVRRADPRLVLELGTYCGYGALRLARAAPAAR